uniref:Olfactory receptor n=1 Tax=Varanus komodoensis TaxID=61221 RepID=A0A8D2JA95_VARKO
GDPSSKVSGFLLLGLSQVKEVQFALFLVFILFYLLILPGNILIIVTIWMDHHLAFPMYFFLANLAFLDICYCSVTPPKMLADFLSEHKTISYGGCMCQLFFLHFLGAAEIFLLMAMAYDRYVAICRPLQYLYLVSRGVCCTWVGVSWLGGFVHAIILVLLTHQLPFCGPNILDNFFCDINQVIKLACTDTYMVEILTFINNGLVILTSFTLLLISYAILITVWKIPSNSGRSKAFSTCSSHLTVVTLFYGTLIFVYILPKTSTLRNLNKIFSVFYTILTPMINPFIYSLRNREFKEAFRRVASKLVPLQVTQGVQPR